MEERSEQEDRRGEHAGVLTRREAVRVDGNTRNHNSTTSGCPQKETTEAQTDRRIDGKTDRRTILDAVWNFR
ncbi:hypothetical protein Pcinc_031692, partial [Petrolisthes cinctipes]